MKSKYDKIDITKINTDFQQADNACFLVSYWITANYYSNNSVSPYDLYEKFIACFPGFRNQIDSILINFGAKLTFLKTKRQNDWQLIKDNPELTKQIIIENSINVKYHHHCINNGDIRGFEFISELHRKNLLNTVCYCDINDIKAEKNKFIDTKKRIQLRNGLKEEGGLAMVLFPHGQCFHTVVVGYDHLSKKYFIRDPNSQHLEFVDFLHDNDIYEFIWFKKAN